MADNCKNHVVISKKIVIFAIKYVHAQTKAIQCE